jgi:hypothetical protein
VREDMSDWTYEERYVRCGKANCRKCAGAAGHGPYWYGYIHRNGRMHTKYFGKHHPQGEEGARRSRWYSQGWRREAPPEPQEAPPADRWTWPRRMDYGSALRILGYARCPTMRELQKRYRDLMKDHHPDHGGTTRAAVAINLAYDYLVSWIEA